MGEPSGERTQANHIASDGGLGPVVDPAGRSRAADAADPMSNRVRPGPLGALFSFVVWPNWTAAILLMATLWMPHFTGCDSRPIRPVEAWSEVEDLEGAVGATAFTWPYLWAGLFAVTLVTVALVRPERPERTLFAVTAAVYVLFALAVQVGAAISVFRAMGLESSAGDTEWIWLFAPAVVAPGIWAALAAQNGNLFSAWARLTTGLIGLAVPTIMLTGIFAMNSRYGFDLAMLACGILLPFCWGLRWRGRRALADRSAPLERLRFRLLHLVVWLTFIAGVCGYYRYLSLDTG